MEHTGHPNHHPNPVARGQAARTPRQSRQQGFTLIETLVAALLLGVALLGLSTLQVWSLATVNQIRFHHQARNHALEISERIRANPAAAASYATHPGDGGGAPCLPLATGAAADLACWHAALRRTLPEAEGAITLSGHPPSLVTITIRWARHERAAAAPTTATPRHTLRWSTRL